VRHDGLGLPLEAQLHRVAPLERLLHEVERVRPDEHGAGPRSGLEARRRIDGIPHRAELDRAGTAHGGQDRESGLDAHPHREALEAALARELA